MVEILAAGITLCVPLCCYVVWSFGFYEREYLMFVVLRYVSFVFSLIRLVTNVKTDGKW